MKNLKKQRRIQIIFIATFALIGAVTLIGIAMKDGINLFRSPTQVLEDAPKPTETFRIGGLVEGGSLVVAEDNSIKFNVTDGNAVIAVTYTGILPDLFSEGEGMVGLGQYDGSVFKATEILAKHDETYMPREVMDALKEQGTYREPE